MAYSKNPETRFFVGLIEVDAAIGVARVDGTPLPLGKKVVATLVALYEHAGEVVTKKALIDSTWPDAAIDDSSLWQNIHVLRGSLAQHAPNAKIETVKGRGYCLRFEEPAATQVSAPAQVPAIPQAAPVTQIPPSAKVAAPARRSYHWGWPIAAALLFAAALNGVINHPAAPRRTLILITTNDRQLPPLPPLAPPNASE
jgi:DNA-binding winged helix-turn-helix (wHTH) protein